MATIRGRLLLRLSQATCGVYITVATIQGVAFIRECTLFTSWLDQTTRRFVDITFNTHACAKLYCTQSFHKKEDVIHVYVCRWCVRNGHRIFYFLQKHIGCGTQLHTKAQMIPRHPLFHFIRNIIIRYYLQECNALFGERARAPNYK